MLVVGMIAADFRAAGRTVDANLCIDPRVKRMLIAFCYIANAALRGRSIAGAVNRSKPVIVGSGFQPGEQMGNCDHVHHLMNL